MSRILNLSSSSFNLITVLSRYNVALSNCQVGKLCVVHNVVCIGQDGKAVDLLLLAFQTFIYFNKEKNSYHLLTK